MIRPARLPRLRSLLLILGLLALVQLGLATYAFLQSTIDDTQRFTFPGPERVRALVAVIEGIDPALRPEAIRAFDNETLDASIVPSRAALPAADADAVMPGLEAVLAAYLATLGEREVIVWIAPDNQEQVIAPRLGPGRLWSRHPLRMAVELQGGAWLLIETRGDLALKVLGFPPGLWAGVFGVTLAFLSLGILWRGLGPLGGLAAALDRFAAHPVPQPVVARGPEETRRIIAAVNRMQEEISSLITEREVMFGALSHDLRTCLTRLSLRAAGIPDADMRGGAERDLARMKNIIDDALEFARLDARLTAPGGMVTLAELLHELRHAYPELPVRADPLPEIQLACDGPELFRALQNLIENAIAYGGGAELFVAHDDRNCCFDVMDRGPGIAEADRAELVKPFVRGKGTAARNLPGSGLGLAIVQRIAVRAGGQFALIDRPGGGTIARLEVPRC